MSVFRPTRGPTLLLALFLVALPFGVAVAEPARPSPPAEAAQPSASPPATLGPGSTLRAGDGERVLSLTLQESLDLGLERNPRMRVAAERVALARGQHGEAASQKNPRFVFQDATILSREESIDTSSLTRLTRGAVPFLDRIVLSDPVQSQIELSLQVLLTTFGQVENQIAAAFLQIGVQEAAYMQDERSLVMDIKQDFFNRLEAEAMVSVALMDLEVSQRSLDDTMQKMAQGLLAQYDVAQAEVKVAQAVQELQATRTQMEVTARSLRTVLFTFDDRLLVPVAPPSVVVDQGLEVEALEELPLARRPEMAVLARNLEVARALLAAAESESNPTVSLAAGYQTSTGSSVGSKDRPSLTFNFQWALFDGGLRGAKEEQARSNIRSLEASLEETRAQIGLQVQQAWSELRLSLFTVETAQKQLESAQVYADMARQRFLVGMSTTLEVQDSLRQLNEARQNVVTAGFERDLDFATLEQALGVDFSDRRLDAAAVAEALAATKSGNAPDDKPAKTEEPAP